MTTLLVAALGLLTPQTFTVNVNLKPGQSISKVQMLHVEVTSNDPVTQVEFYVGGELRDSDSSVPYDFKLDTIEEKDGPTELTFAAYTSKGDSAKKSINVQVDNGVALGPDPHVAKGIEDLQVSDWPDAILEGRIALKADPVNNRARMVMARAYLGMKALDKAQKYAEDWLASEPSNPDAGELMSGIHLNKAFNTMSRGDDRMSALKDIQAAFKTAINTKQKVLEGKLDRLGAPTSENVVAYADAAMKAGRYSLAIAALDPEYRKHADRPEVTNRLAYAQLRAGRMQDAMETLNQVEKLFKLDAYGAALQALVHSLNGDETGSTRYMGDALLQDPANLGARTVQAYLALRAKKTYLLSQIAANLAADAGEKPAVNYYLCALANAMGNYEAGRKYFRTGILADPCSEPLYLEEANQDLYFAMRLKGSEDERKFRIASAIALFQTALEARPESYRALEGIALANILAGNKLEAVKYAKAAVNAAPTQASAHFTASAAYLANSDIPNSTRENNLAGRYDRKNLFGLLAPRGPQAWEYYSQADRIPVIAMPQ